MHYYFLKEIVKSKALLYIHENITYAIIFLDFQEYLGRSIPLEIEYTYNSYKYDKINLTSYKYLLSLIIFYIKLKKIFKKLSR